MLTFLAIFGFIAGESLMIILLVGAFKIMLDPVMGFWMELSMFILTLALFVFVNGGLWIATNDLRHPCIQTQEQAVFHPSHSVYRQVGKVTVYVGETEENTTYEPVCIKRK